MYIGLLKPLESEIHYLLCQVFQDTDKQLLAGGLNKKESLPESHAAERENALVWHCDMHISIVPVLAQTHQVAGMPLWN